MRLVAVPVGLARRALQRLDMRSRRQWASLHQADHPPGGRHSQPFSAKWVCKCCMRAARRLVSVSNTLE
jgi:hypothetical protein